MSGKSDPDYWKRLYQGAWATSAKREDAVLSLLRNAGWNDAQLSGLGAGSTELLHGKPEQYGKKKGDPDITIPSVGVTIEVTGTDVPTVHPGSALWVRPDKVKNAKDHPDMDAWVVHSLDNEKLLRVIRLSPSVIKKLLDTNPTHPFIKGVRETYIPIPASDPIVEPFPRLLEYLEKKKARDHQQTL